MTGKPYYYRNRFRALSLFRNLCSNLRLCEFMTCFAVSTRQWGLLSASAIDSDESGTRSILNGVRQGNETCIFFFKKCFISCLILSLTQQDKKRILDNRSNNSLQYRSLDKNQYISRQEEKKNKCPQTLLETISVTHAVSISPVMIGLAKQRDHYITFRKEKKEAIDRFDLTKCYDIFSHSPLNKEKYLFWPLTKWTLLHLHASLSFSAVCLFLKTHAMRKCEFTSQNWRVKLRMKRRQDIYKNKEVGVSLESLDSGWETWQICLIILWCRFFFVVFLQIVFLYILLCLIHSHSRLLSRHLTYTWVILPCRCSSLSSFLTVFP